MKILKVLMSVVIVTVGSLFAFALAVFACSLIGKAGLPEDVQTGSMAFATFPLLLWSGLSLRTAFLLCKINGSTMDEIDLKALGFHLQEGEFVNRLEGGLMLVISRYPSNIMALYCRLPDGGLLEMRAESKEDIRAAQRMLTRAYYENAGEAFFPSDHNEN